MSKIDTIKHHRLTAALWRGDCKTVASKELPTRHFLLLNFPAKPICEHKFIQCGLLGWLFEIIWTGFGNLIHHDPTMNCTTSLIMFPIYGLAAFIAPIYKLIKDNCLLIRGFIYTMLIFIIEFSTGIVLKKFHMCPWDYSNSSYNIKGVVRLDYAPAWFVVGLIYEKLLQTK